jgi:hypothetical protein
MMFVRSVFLNDPILGCYDFLNNLFPEFLSLLRFEYDHIISSLHMNPRLLFKQDTHFVLDIVRRVNAQHSDIETIVELLFDVELLQVARQEMNLDLGLSEAI